MNTLELKSTVHALIDRIENDALLESIHDFLVVKETSSPGTLWASLTKEQKEEVLVSFEESENPKNLLSREEFFTANQ